MLPGFILGVTDLVQVWSIKAVGFPLKQSPELNKFKVVSGIILVTTKSSASTFICLGFYYL